MTRTPGAEDLYAFVDRLAAQHEQPEEEPEPLEEWLEFEAGGLDLGLPVTAVLEVVRPRPVTRVPGAPPAVRGLINLRGRALPLVDLGAHLGLAAAQGGDDARIVVLESRGRRFGALVERVSRLAKIAPSTIRRLSEGESPVPPAVVRGAGPSAERPRVLLDPERILLTGDDPSA
ncbi:MAG: chemotaxis protein CheW [Thermoanaerobaculia bacterium]|nr:chemotaxis protein CheW [Thermoanaerobaculia bacterium]